MKTLKNIVFLYNKVAAHFPEAQELEKAAETGESIANEEGGSDTSDAAEEGKVTAKKTADQKSLAGADVPADVAGNFPEGPIQSRAQAYAQLSAVADYLQATEPHSPTPYLIRRAMSWRDLSLGALLMDLFQSSGGNLPQILAVLGLDEAQSQAAQQQVQQQQVAQQQVPPQ